MHHQGDSYIGTRFQHDLFAAWLFKRMGAGKVFTDHMQYVTYQIVYHLRPDGQQMRSGDTYDDRGKSSGKRLMALYAGSYYNDPYLMTLADSDIFWSFNAVNRVFELLFRPAGAAKQPAAVPAGRGSQAAAGGAASDQVFCRTHGRDGGPDRLGHGGGFPNSSHSYADRAVLFRQPPAQGFRYVPDLL
jgi:hypothetical protein